MDEALDVRLPPWFAINNSALKRNSLKKILTIIEIIKLYSAQNGCGHVRMCPIHSPIHRICPSPLKCQTKFGSNQVLYELLLSSVPFTFVPYATLCSIRNSMFMFFIYILNNPTIYFGHKLTFFLKFNKFQSLKLFFRDFSSSANLV